MRRDFVECAAGRGETDGLVPGMDRADRVDLPPERGEVGSLRPRDRRERQTPAFDAAQGALKEALDGLFAEAARELVGLPDQARQGRALRSLLNHREGLSVFVDRPQVPLDNNRAERFTFTAVRP